MQLENLYWNCFTNFLSDGFLGFQIVYSQKQELIITLEVDILTSQPPTVLDSLFPSLGESRRFPKLQYVKEEIVKSKEDNFNK